MSIVLNYSENDNDVKKTLTTMGFVFKLEIKA
jgi:hypothetical protein